MADRRIVGALIGWKRRPTQNGIILMLQVLTPGAFALRGDFDNVTVVLNDRQLRSFARDLQRAAMSRGISLGPKPKWWHSILR